MSTNQGWEKWYWRDWKSDPAVAKLDGACRSIWFEVLGEMWLQETCRWTGSMDDLALAANVDLPTVERFLEEAKKRDLCELSVTVTQCHSAVTLVSRRKKKEEKVREQNRLRQQRKRRHAQVTAVSQGESESESESESERTPLRAPPKAGNGKRLARGTRLPTDFQFPSDWRDWAMGFNPDVNCNLEFEKFRDYWVAQPGQKGVKLDWLATWRNWIRNARPGNSREEPSLYTKPIPGVDT